MVLGSFFMIFNALETGLKIDDFSWLSGAAPDPATQPVEGDLIGSGSPIQQSECWKPYRIFNTTSNMQEYKGYGNTRMQNEKKRRNDTG